MAETLMQLALALLFAAQGVDVPIEKKLEAIDLANYAISVALEERSKAAVPTSVITVPSEVIEPVATPITVPICSLTATRAPDKTMSLSWVTDAPQASLRWPTNEYSYESRGPVFFERSVAPHELPSGSITSITNSSTFVGSVGRFSLVMNTEQGGYIDTCWTTVE